MGGRRRTSQDRTVIDNRMSWQKAQGAACSCKGTDEWCGCQNINQADREPDIDWQSRALAAEAALQASREREKRIPKLEAALRVCRGYVLNAIGHSGLDWNKADLATIDAALAPHGETM